MPQFSGARAKIERATDQMNALQKVFEGFYKRNRNPIRQEVDRDAGEKRLVVHTEPLDLQWSVIIGEIMFDLRSALDHCVYELSLSSSGIPLSGTEFPIFHDEAKYFAADKRGRPARGSGHYKIRGITNPQVRAAIDELQPFEFYKTHDRTKEMPAIALVHDLNIIDKHLTLHLCIMTVSNQELKVLRPPKTTSVQYTVMTRLEEGAIITSWKPVEPPDDKVDMKCKPTFEIAFGDTLPFLENNRVIATCKSLIDGIERVLFLLENLSTA